MGRVFQFIDHCHGEILNGDVALPARIGQEFVPAEAEMSSPLPRLHIGRAVRVSCIESSGCE
jgi:hypothetical protein